jgi:hypothetical protein
LNACDDLGRPTATAAKRDINTEHALKPLRPGHFFMYTQWRFDVLLGLSVLLANTALTNLGSA